MNTLVLSAWLPAFIAGLFIGGGTVFLVGRYKKRVSGEEAQKPGMHRLLQSVWKEASEETWTEFRSLRHGYINTLISISHLLKRGRQEEALRYADQRLEELKSPEGGKKSHSFIDLFLDYKIRKCGEEGFSFHREIEVPRELPFDEEGLSIILGSTFDHAVEAIKMLPKEERYVRITIGYKKHALRIVIENSCQEGFRWDSSRRSALEKAVEGYHGMVEASCDGKASVVKILLYAGGISEEGGLPE